MRKHGQRGGALLEFAIVAPFMFMIFFAAIEFGWVMYLYHSVDYGARLGSRYASVRGANCTNASVCPVTAALITTYVQQTAPLPNATVSATWAGPPATYFQQPVGTCGAGSAEYQGCVVNVTVSVPWHFVIPFVYTGNITLTSSSSNILQL
jgi:Flp pilus assembly protein TadG